MINERADPRTARLGITLQAGQAGAHAAPNEMFIYHEQVFNAREGGRCVSNEKIYVAENTIWAWLNQQETDQVIRLAVAATCAHEIGHALLGFNVHEDDDTNVMNPGIDNWLPRLRQNPPLPPTFNPDQRDTIRHKLGYPNN